MCPFWKKPCSKIKDCHLRRKGMRYFDDNRKPEYFEECGFLLAIDLLENATMRIIGMQKATEGARNQISKVNEFIEQVKDLKKIKALEDKKDA